MPQIVDPTLVALVNARGYVALQTPRRNSGNTAYEWGVPGWLDQGQTWTPASGTNTFVAPTSGKAIAAKAAATTPGNIQEWQNTGGTALSKVASNGYLGVNVGTDAVGDVIDFKSPGNGWGMRFRTSTSGTSASGGFRQGATGAPFFFLRDSSGGSDYVVIDGAGDSYIQAGGAAKKALIIRGVASQSANLQEWQKSDTTIYGTVSENGYFTTRKITALADGELSASEMAFWFDSTNGAAKLMVKAKTADGTVVTGSLALA